jgi:ketosteroid isomerase-like protein
MMRIVFGVAFLVATAAAAFGQATATQAKPEDRIMALVNELREAAKRKDRAVYERLIAENFFFIHANGATATRKMYIDNWMAGGLSAQQDGNSVKMLDENVTMHGDAAAVHVMRSVLSKPAQGTEQQMRVATVFAKVNGRWQKIFGETSMLPDRPKSATVDYKLYDGYVGQYDVRPGVVFTVRREGNSLHTTQTGRQNGELIPKSDTEFIWYNPDMIVDGQVIFVKDPAGQVTHAVFRMNGNEIWRAKKIR